MQPVYVLDLTCKKCIVRGQLNGFPIFSIDAKYSTNFAPPINTSLVGRSNNLILDVLPIVEGSNSIPNLSDMKVEGAVKVYENGGVSAPELGERLVEIQLTGLPTGSYSFDNEGPSFRKLLLESEPSENKDELLDYGVYLRDLAEEKDVERLLHEFTPKLIDFATAYYDAPQEYFRQFQQFMLDDFLKAGVVRDFERNEILPIRWCEGRVWELSVGLNKQLLRSFPDGDGVSNFIPVFVSRIGGRLRVVR